MRAVGAVMWAWLSDRVLPMDVGAWVMWRMERQSFWDHLRWGVDTSRTVSVNIGLIWADP